MYDTLISQINAYIRDNATNDISGGGLNVILRAMLDALGLGMRFYGMATTGTTPVSNQYPKFYVSFVPGYYSNFNITNHPKFASGFAIIYDEDGTNTWRMAVKQFQAEDGFLIDSTVKNNTFGTDTDFFIKDVNKTSASSSFTIYAYNKNSTTEQLVATYTYNGLLSGYKTHEIETGNTKYVVSVNWDNVPLNEQVEFTHDESKFPVTAYVESSSDIDNQNLLERLIMVEKIGGNYNVNDDMTISRQNPIAADFYVARDMTVDFLQPATFQDMQNTFWYGTNIRSGYMNPAAFGSQQRVNLNLKLSNFPAKTTYHIYIPNTSQVDHILNVNQLDTNNTILNTSVDYTLHADSIIDVCVIRMENTLRYKISEFIY